MLYWYIVVWTYGADDPLDLLHIVRACNPTDARALAYAQYLEDCRFAVDDGDEPEGIDEDEVHIQHILRCDTEPVYVYFTKSP